MSIRTADSAWPEIFRQVWRDLQPFPGRFGLTWRVALLCALVSGTAMVMKIPEASISCYLIIFLMKQDAVQNCLMGFGLILLATGVVALMIPIINMSIDSAMLRLAVMFFASYIFLFLASATPLGEQAAIVGLIIAFILTLVTDVPVGEIGNQGLLMAWKMACMPMFLMILFNMLLGIPAQSHVRNKIVDRLRRSADRIETGQTSREFADLLGEGNDLSLQQMMTVRLLHLVPKVRSAWLNGAVETSYRILIASDGMSGTLAQEQRAALATQLRAAANEIAAQRIPAPSPPPEDVPTDAAECLLRAALADLSHSNGGGDPCPRKIPPLAADAFTNPDHQRYALKTSLAAVLCYLIYTGIQWDGIHTAMITCYVAALGTTGETVRKLTLRICGCLIGAALGALVLVHVMPNLTSIGGLMLMVFGGVLVGAWVSSGSERIYYAGVQIALAFLLTTLNGFGPSYEFSQASGRIFGILLGIIVIYVLFTQFWPHSVIKDVRSRLSDTLEALSRLGLPAEGNTRERTEIATAARIYLAQAADLLEAAPFEPRRLRAREPEIRQLRSFIEEMGSLATRLYLAGPDQPEAMSRLRQIEEGLLPRKGVETQPVTAFGHVATPIQ